MKILPSVKDTSVFVKVRKNKAATETLVTI